MVGETSTTPLSKDPFASEQLLRAAEQLQDAIKSARKRRSSHTTHAASMLLSPHTTRIRSDICATFEDEDAFVDISEQSDKENVRHNGPRGSSGSAGIADKMLAARCDTGLKQQLHHDRFSREMTQSMSGEMLLDLASISDCSEDDSDEGNDREPLRSRHMTRSEMDKSIGEMTRRALDWMQQDTEKQAKENKAMQELLHGVISIINGVVSDLAPPSGQHDGVRFAASGTRRHIPEVKHWKELSIDKVAKLVSEWETVLLNWRKAALDSKKDARERCELFQEECDAKVRQICELHEVERVLCEDYAGEVWNTAAQVAATTESVDRRQRFPRLGGELSDNQLFLERETMNAKGQVKEAELCSLRWQMAYEDQVTSSRQMEERLEMLLEETTDTQRELQEQKRRVSRMIHVDALKIYQQKIALLEDQVHDTQQQVACDHEQFLCEQTTWEYEKKHLGKEVQEIQDVSVKVLTMLLIREKMLKKQERHLQKRSLGFESRQSLLTDQFNALQAITQELMQECALILVALQEQQTTSVSRSSHLPTGQNLIPVKPLQIKKMIKRLRKVQRVLETQQRCVSGNAESLFLPGAE